MGDIKVTPADAMMLDNVREKFVNAVLNAYEAIAEFFKNDALVIVVLSRWIEETLFGRQVEVFFIEARAKLPIDLSNAEENAEDVEGADVNTDGSNASGSHVKPRKRKAESLQQVTPKKVKATHGGRRTSSLRDVFKAEADNEHVDKPLQVKRDEPALTSRIDTLKQWSKRPSPMRR